MFKMTKLMDNEVVDDIFGRLNYFPIVLDFTFDVTASPARLVSFYCDVGRCKSQMMA